MRPTGKFLIGVLTALAVGGVLLAVGCQQSDSTSVSSGNVDPQSAAEVNSSGPGDSSAAASGQEAIAPILDEQAVNEDGLVVLYSPDSASGEHAATAESSASRHSAPADEAHTNGELQSAAGQTAADSPAPEPSGSAEITATLTANAGNSNIVSRKSEARGGLDSVSASERVSESERNQQIAPDWPEPQAVIYVSGQQHGYIEPCGCTGLDNQKGGLIRRDTVLAQLKDRDWNLIPVDVGNQVRRIGPQPEIKFQTSVDALKLMGYRAATLGVDDLKLSSIELIGAASSDELNPGAFISANVTIIDPSFFPPYRIIEEGGRKVGITAALGLEYKDEIQSDDVEVADPVSSLKPIVSELKAEGCDFLVLLAHASLEESAEMARQVPGFDLVVTAGGYGEPTLLPEPIEGSDAVMVQVGIKGMYGGIVGLFDDPQQPIRYQKIAITSQFEDSPRMLEQFARYQEKLQLAGYDGLGINPISHPSGREYVGSETCGECHTTAYEIWEDSPHVHATESIVAPPNDRGGTARHYDPECISCHVTGWNPQGFYPYQSGWISTDQSEHLVGSGCENCHGPGKNHVAAEYGDLDVDNDTLLELRQQMVIKLEHAREKCLECHDLDNSPDFHEEGAFDEYWEQVKHYGLD